MGIIAWIVLGGIAGWIASIIMRTDAQQGIFGNVIVGIVGALIGGFVVSLFGQTPVNGFNLYSLLVALLGSVILLWIVKAVRGHGTTV